MTGRNPGRRGLTLLEVIVAIGVAVVISGIAVGVLLSTNQAANQGMSHDALLQKAELAMKEIRSVIEGTVWPEDVATTPPAGMAMTFTTGTLALVSSYQPTTTGQFCRYEFLNQTAPAANDAATTAGFFRAAPGSAGKGEFRSLAGRTVSAIQFRYAIQVGADLQPVWQPTIPTGQKPRLIWVEVVLRDPKRLDRRGQPDEVRLATAVAL